MPLQIRATGCRNGKRPQRLSAQSFPGSLNTLSIAHSSIARSVAQLEPDVPTLSLGLFARFAPLAPTSFSVAWEADLSGLHFLGPLILSFPFGFGQ